MTASANEPKASSLQGLRILVVEDEMMIAMLVEDLLEGFGCTIVGPAASIAQALRLISTEAIDGATLDVNLSGHSVHPVADELARRGIPFIFMTGYGSQKLAGNHKDRPSLLKPFRKLELQCLMAETFTATSESKSR